MMIKLGLDIGSRNSKLVLWDESANAVIYSHWVATDISPQRSVATLIASALGATGLPESEITHRTVTGYGRKLMNKDYQVLSELTCHAAGCRHLNPNIRTIIDIGGQDAKVMCLNTQGKIGDFVMNDKCAAGTGRFLEMTALRLGIAVNELSALATAATQDLKLNSTCVVFAESEIIGMMSTATAPADIARAVHLCVAKRIQLQAAGLDLQPTVCFTGGVALNGDIAACLASTLNAKVWTPQEPEITAALGAAILA